MLPRLVPGGRPFYHENTCFFCHRKCPDKGQNSFLKSGIGSGRGIFESHAKYGLRIGSGSGIESGRSGSGARAGEGSGARVGVGGIKCGFKTVQMGFKMAPKYTIPPK